MEKSRFLWGLLKLAVVEYLFSVVARYNEGTVHSLACRDAVRQEGTHAMGRCEPGQAGRSSHKHLLFVRWISLSCLTLLRQVSFLLLNFT